jgi:alpha-L-fucosidase
MKPVHLLLSVLLLSVQLQAQVKPAAGLNYAFIQPGDTEADIVRKAATIVPSPRQLRWQQLELTAFFHFGVNTFTDKEWGDGKEDPAVFNPTALDAEQWIRTVKNAGFRQVIITAKHHDGFCLWPTKTTSHSVASSPWKNGQGDVVKAVADACRRYGIGFGVYLSPWDRNAAVYGTAGYNDFFVRQLTELLTWYGKVDEVWFDGANGEGPNGKKQVYDFNRWYALIRQLQPGATIAVMGPDVRWVGTESGYGRQTEWSVVPSDQLDANAIAANSQKDMVFKPAGDMMGDDLGSRSKIRNGNALVWYPAETDVSIRPGWFYHEKEDSEVKSAAKLLDIYFSSVGRNGVLLLNIPPNRKGQISAPDSLHLQEFAKLRNQIFHQNLAKLATVQSANGLGVLSLTDQNYRTYWTTRGSDTTADLVFEFRQPISFGVLALQENIKVGQRIEQFILETWEKEQWRPIIEGTTVGYKRLLEFPTVSSRKLRLRILSSRLNPTLSEIGFYPSSSRL